MKKTWNRTCIIIFFLLYRLILCVNDKFITSDVLETGTAGGDYKLLQRQQLVTHLSACTFG